MEGAFECFARLGSAKLRNRLLSSKISIVERLDFPVIQVQRIGENLKFFRKNVEIERKDRMLDSSLSAAITSLSKISEQLDENRIFEFHYQTDPIVIEYDSKLKGGLAFICERRGDLHVYDLKLPISAPCIGRSEVESTKLWEGVMTQEMVDQLVPLIAKSTATPIIPSQVMSIFGITSKLNEDINKPIRSLMIRIGSWNPDVIVIEDPVYESHRLMEIKKRGANDIFGLVVSDFVEHVEMNHLLKNLPAIGESVQERFLNCVSFLCKSFVDAKSKNYDSKDLGKEQLDITMLPQSIQESMKKDEAGTKLFQMVASSIYSPKKKPSGTITEATISNLNHIKNSIAAKSKETASGILTYNEYLLTR